jgi:hypothetical protein
MYANKNLWGGWGAESFAKYSRLPWPAVSALDAPAAGRAAIASSLSENRRYPSRRRAAIACAKREETWRRRAPGRHWSRRGGLQLDRRDARAQGAGPFGFVPIEAIPRDTDLPAARFPRKFYVFAGAGNSSLLGLRRSAASSERVPCCAVECPRRSCSPVYDVT